MRHLLEIDSVFKSFGDRVLLNDIYIRCETGDVIGIFGRNGTGKSTLLKIIFGVLSAENKFIKIDGKVLDQPYKLSGEVCYLPQHHFLPGHLSIKNCVNLYLSSNKIDPFFDDPFLNDLKNSKVSHLSGGELRYLEVKLLLHTDCKFVLLDEPFSGVAPLMTKQIQEIITAKASEKGILLTDHDYASVLSVARSYRLLYNGALNELKSRHELVKWGYVSKAREQQHP